MPRTLQTILDAGVLVFFYKTNEELRLDTPIQKIMLSLKGFSGENHNYNLRTNTSASLRGRAEDGHVTGGRVFGYTNVRHGKVVDRVINPEEREVILRIFSRYAEGQGLYSITRDLNRDYVPGPRGKHWSQGGISVMLRNPIYRGEVVFGQIKTYWVDGGTRRVLRPTDPETWVRRDHPDLRIVPDILWDRVQRELKARGGPREGRALRTTIGDCYLLTGFLACGVCGGRVRGTVRGSWSGSRRRYVPSYTCSAFETKGSCRNAVTLPASILDAAVIASVARYLDDGIVSSAVDAAVGRLVERRGPDTLRRQHLAEELAGLDRKGARLAAAIAEAGDMAPLLAELKAVEARRRAVEGEARGLGDDAPAPDPAEVKGRVLNYARDVRGLLGETPGSAKKVLGSILGGKIRMEPFGARRTRGYRWHGNLAINRVVEDVTRASSTTPPEGRGSERMRRATPQA